MEEEGSKPEAQFINIQKLKTLIESCNSNFEAKHFKDEICKMKAPSIFQIIQHNSDNSSEPSNSSDEREFERESQVENEDSEEQKNEYITACLEKLMDAIYLKEKSFKDIKESVRTLKMSDSLTQTHTLDAMENSRYKYFQVLLPTNQLNITHVSKCILWLLCYVRQSIRRAQSNSSILGPPIKLFPVSFGHGRLQVIRELLLQIHP